MEPKFLTWSEQAELLQSRGMKLEQRDKETLKSISYYKIKEFAKPFATYENGEINYCGVTFSEVMKRYYQDKNLRIHLLHAIEQIEVALKTRIAYILGEYYGAYGYLNFYRWANRKKYTKFEIEKKQYRFKEQLLKIVRKSRSDDLQEKTNQDKDGFPTVWLAMNSIMFGGIVTIVSIMSNKHLKKLARYFGCTGKELISWVKCLNFIRNICAHNSNVIDIRLETAPLIRDKWLHNLYMIEGKNNSRRVTNRLAIVIYIIIVLTNSINDKYRWREIQSSVERICSNDSHKANLLGFDNSKEAINFSKLSKEL